MKEFAIMDGDMFFQRLEPNEHFYVCKTVGEKSVCHPRRG